MLHNDILMNLIQNVPYFVVTGLVCSAILEKLSEKVSDVNEQVLSKDLEEHSK